MTPKSEESTDFYTKWSKVIKNMELPKREPMWEKAIDVMNAEGDCELTMRLTLPMEHIEDMLFEKGVNGEEASIYDIFTDIAKWINCVDMTDYLCRNFHNGAEVMLAYFMATQYGLFWDGDDNVMVWKTP